jgi:peptidoglycan/LPS O-acetylase OafA/YrhL
MAEDGRTGGDAFRPDLEGLRGVAILLVLVYHAGVAGAGGGFVGVDVFFVLSGFLITGLLLRERERRGRVDLAAFYARRVRRILPAALVVALGTLVLSLLVLAPLDVPSVATDAVASALSAGNIRFAATSMDYFASDAPPSPFLHYWSLGVEEQFYLVWPALLILATRYRRPRLGAGVALLGVLVASFVASYLLTDVAASWAFYSLPTRAWQLGLGGLLAVTVAWHRRIPSWALAPVGVAGLGAILASLVLIDGSTPYPGVVALLPTLGAAAVILAGDRRWSVGSALRLAPLRFFGRISFSLYLVHWPLFVLAGAGLAIGASLPFEERIGLAVASIVIASASYRWVEQPFRRGRALALPARRTIALGGVAVAATIAVALGVDANVTSELGAYASVSASAPGGVVAGSPSGGSAKPSGSSVAAGGDVLAGGAGGPSAPGGPLGVGEPSPSVDASPSPSPSPGPSGAATPGATPAATRPPLAFAPLPALGTAAAPGAIPNRLPPDVRPSLIDAPNDWDPLLRDGCTAQELTVQPPDCVYGDPKGRFTVALVGDSHAEQWFPALERIATASDWRLLPFTKFSCRFVDLATYSRILKRPYTECDTWRELVIRRLEALKPDLVVVSVAAGLAPMVAADADPRRQGAGLARLIERIPGRIAIIADTPIPDYVVPSCLSRHVNDVAACATPRSRAFGPWHLVLERTAARASGATVVDLSSAICPTDPCPAVLDGMIVYRDAFHLTATFSAALAGDLVDALEPLLAAPAATPVAGRASPSAATATPSSTAGSPSLSATAPASSPATVSSGSPPPDASPPPSPSGGP